MKHGLRFDLTTHNEFKYYKQGHITTVNADEFYGVKDHMENILCYVCVICAICDNSYTATHSHNGFKWVSEAVFVTIQ